MRMSCNGCRVLRKGCGDDCSIRPCLQWIKNPDHQANATLFLAKFYGRAGLLNLLRSGPDHLRPAIFRSLLYEACGRIVNPVYGAVGLLWSGSWNLCQAAVDAVLRGAPLEPPPEGAAAAAAAAPRDIRPVPRSARPRFGRTAAGIGDPRAAPGTREESSGAAAAVELELTLGMDAMRRWEAAADDGEGEQPGLELAA